MNKFKLCFDVETTGLLQIGKKKQPAITQIGALIIAPNGKIVNKFNEKMNPFTLDRGFLLSDEALKITNTSIDELHSYPSQKKIFKKFQLFLGEYVDPYARGDNYTPIGYNSSRFDEQMLQMWFKDNKAVYGGFIGYKGFDVYELVKLFLINKWDFHKLPNHQLSTIAKHLSINIDAHDALSDIEATWEIYKTLKKRLKDGV